MNTSRSNRERMRLSEVAAEVTRSSEYMEICSKLGGTALKTVGAKRHVVSKAIEFSVVNKKVNMKQTKTEL